MSILYGLVFVVYKTRVNWCDMAQMDFRILYLGKVPVFNVLMYTYVYTEELSK